MHEFDEPWHKNFPNVHCGADATISDFCVLGKLPRGKKPGELEARIGACDVGAIIKHVAY